MVNHWKRWRRFANRSGIGFFAPIVAGGPNDQEAPNGLLETDACRVSIPDQACISLLQPLPSPFVTLMGVRARFLAELSPASQPAP